MNTVNHITIEHFLHVLLDFLVFSTLAHGVGTEGIKLFL